MRFLSDFSKDYFILIEQHSYVNLSRNFENVLSFSVFIALPGHSFYFEGLALDFSIIWNSYQNLLYIPRNTLVNGMFENEKTYLCMALLFKSNIQEYGESMEWIEQ